MTNFENLTTLSLEQLAQLETNIAAERARRRGESVTVYDRDGDHPCPSGGAILHVRWAVSDQSHDDWYPTTEAANAALEAIASGHGREVSRNRDGYSCDLTCSGCHSSYAWVEPRD